MFALDHWGKRIMVYNVKGILAILTFKNPYVIEYKHSYQSFCPVHGDLYILSPCLMNSVFVVLVHWNFVLVGAGLTKAHSFN